VTASRAEDQAFTEPRALDAVTQAADAAGLASRSARLLRLGENAVFELDGGVVARVARGVHSQADVRRTVAVARWLAAAGIPAVQALDVNQPVECGGLLGTFWESLGDGQHYGTTADLAQLLRKLHSAEPPAGLCLPQLDPFDRAERRLKSAPIADDDRAFLLDRMVQLKDRYAAMAFVLPAGVIHGDANVGNVLVGQDGTPRLIDLDGFCTGAREWDLILTAIYYDRYGWHTREEYEIFCQSYGYDVRAWPGYEVLADVREFLMVTWMSQNADQDARTSAELAKRIHSLRSGSGRRDWQAY
jgi:hypothetical protein